MASDPELEGDHHPTDKGTEASPQREREAPAQHNKSLDINSE